MAAEQLRATAVKEESIQMELNRTNVSGFLTAHFSLVVILTHSSI